VTRGRRAGQHPDALASILISVAVNFVLEIGARYGFTPLP
jgi:hypothetical protein